MTEIAADKTRLPEIPVSELTETTPGAALVLVKTWLTMAQHKPKAPQILVFLGLQCYPQAHGCCCGQEHRDAGGD